MNSRDQEKLKEWSYGDGRELTGWMGETSGWEGWRKMHDLNIIKEKGFHHRKAQDQRARSQRPDHSTHLTGCNWRFAQ